MPVIDENCSWQDVNYRSAHVQHRGAHCSAVACARLTAVVAVVLPPGHETLAFDEDADEESARRMCGKSQRQAALLFFIEYFPESVRPVCRAFRGITSSVMPKPVRCIGLTSARSCGGRAG